MECRVLRLALWELQTSLGFRSGADCLYAGWVTGAPVTV